jgi:hypothetical protein
MNHLVTAVREAAEVAKKLNYPIIVWKSPKLKFEYLRRERLRAYKKVSREQVTNTLKLRTSIYSIPGTSVADGTHQPSALSSFTLWLYSLYLADVDGCVMWL